MNHDHVCQPGHITQLPFWWSRYTLGLRMFGGIAAYSPVREYRAHFFGAFPFLPMLVCPLIHVFVHGGHGGGLTGRAPAFEAYAARTPRFLRSFEKKAFTV